MDNPDVLIIGAGMGGLITGAILAKEGGMKVLILEKESEIGGRVLSFGGPHGTYSEEEYRRLLKGGAGIRVIKTKPALAEIIDKKCLFDNYIIDGGWHGMSAGNRCRYSILARALGKDIPVANQVGLLYYRDGKWVERMDYVKVWPKESIKERNRLARERLTLSIEEASEYDHVDLKSYLEAQTEDQLVQDYFGTLAKYQFGINDVKEISTGEWIKCNNMTSATGAHLTHGGGMGDVEGGFKVVANVFAEIIKENGGEVRTSARVKEVTIKGNKAKGVIVEQNGKSSTIEAPIVISDLPMDTVFSIIPEKYFPEALKQRITGIHTMSGILGHIALKELLETEWPKGMFVLDKLPGPELKGGLPLFGFEQTSAVDPSRILKGSGHIIQTWVGLWTRDPDERNDEKLLNELCEAKLNFLRKQYPKFDDLMEWYIFVLAERVYGITPTPGFIGDMRPSVKHPLIKNLYFTGDTVSQWDVGSSGAAHGAVICASAVAGRDHLRMLPPYMR